MYFKSNNLGLIHFVLFSLQIACKQLNQTSHKALLQGTSQPQKTVRIRIYCIFNLLSSHLQDFLAQILERRSVPSRYHGSKIATTSATATRTENEHQVYISKTTTLHAFLYISQPSLHDCDLKLSNFTRPPYSVANITPFSSSFSKLGYRAFGFEPRIFFQHLTNSVKLNKISEL